MCGGLLIGYRAAKAAMRFINSSFSKDEELVAIVENSSCFVDAVSVMTGCTFGKGNLIFKDYGKMAMSLLNRKNGEGVRVYFRSEIYADPHKEFPDLMSRVLEGTASEEEKKLFNRIKKERERNLLIKKDNEIFSIKRVKEPLPPMARIFKSIKCDICSEMVMEGKLRKTKKGMVCFSCAGK